MDDLFLIVPFIILVLINLLPEKWRGEVGYWLTLILVGLQTLLAVFVPLNFWNLSSSIRLEHLFGFKLQLTTLMALLICVTGLAAFSALLVARVMIKKASDRFNFLNLLLIALIGMNGLAMTRDLFSFYVFIEVTALASFLQINLYRDRRGQEAVWKYLIMSVMASTLLLSGLAIFLLIAGGTSLAQINVALQAGTGFLPRLGLALFVCGLLVKGGVVPFHGWLPDAYTAAPAPVSVLLAGIVTKACGIYGLARLFSLLTPVNNVLLFLGTASIIVGALAALGQKDLKRLLAYSSISQIGYIVLAFGIGNQLGYVAALFHFFNHAVLKSQLFANAAALEVGAGTTELEKLNGAGPKMPVTSITTLIAMLSTAGLPPLAGFWSKLLIILALWFAGLYTYAVIAILASVLTLAYFLYVQRNVFFCQPIEAVAAAEPRLTLLLPALILCTITISLGLVFPFAIGMFVR